MIRLRPAQRTPVIPGGQETLEPAHWRTHARQIQARIHHAAVAVRVLGGRGALQSKEDQRCPAANLIYNIRGGGEAAIRSGLATQHFEARKKLLSIRDDSRYLKVA